MLTQDTIDYFITVVLAHFLRVDDAREGLNDGGEAFTAYLAPRDVFKVIFDQVRDGGMVIPGEFLGLFDGGSFEAQGELCLHGIRIITVELYVKFFPDLRLPLHSLNSDLRSQPDAQPAGIADHGAGDISLAVENIHSRIAIDLKAAL